MNLETIAQPKPEPLGKDYCLDEHVALTTRTGFEFLVRPARPSDEPALGDFFDHVAKDDLRFRFLTAIQKVGHELLAMMTSVDHDRTETFLAFAPDERTIIATAMIAADEGKQRGEVALSIRSDFKKRGISWTLLEHVADWAKSKGFMTLESLESRQHHAAIELEREMGFKAQEYPGDPTLILLTADLKDTSK